MLAKTITELHANPKVPATALGKRKSKAAKNRKTPRGVRGLSMHLQRLMALIGLLVLSPLLLLTVIVIRRQSPGAAIYTQIRVGHLGRRFKIYKFRSMYMPSDPRYVDPSTLASDREGACKKFFKDPRITPFGRIIRKLSIDELPQLFNVVKGDMALVGPRPALPIEVDDYTHGHFQRLDVTPGLTGLWQISGRADTTFEEQMNLDRDYVASKDVFLDLKILFLTLPAVLSGKGAY